MAWWKTLAYMEMGTKMCSPRTSEMDTPAAPVNVRTVQRQSRDSVHLSWRGLSGRGRQWPYTTYHR
jgi:hypothetical protein